MSTDDDDYAARVYAAELVEGDEHAPPIKPGADETPETASIDCVNGATGRLKVRYANRYAASVQTLLLSGTVPYLCNRPPMFGRRAGCGYWHVGTPQQYD